MTGRDLILYILSNNLEDEPVFNEGKLLGFMTVEEAAVKFDVGIATVKVWANFKAIPSIKLGDTFYIPSNAEPYVEHPVAR